MSISPPRRPWRLSAVLVAVLTMLAAASAALAASAAAWTPDEADFIVVSGPASPRVAYAVRREDASLRMVIEVDVFDSGAASPDVQVGLAAARTVRLDGDDAEVRRADIRTRYVFEVPIASLITAPEDWTRLRMSLAVAWPGGPFGKARQRERFRHTDGRSPHANLARDPAAWQPLNLADYAARVADRRRRILIPFTQPLAGKATLVIEDGEGRRVRNLIAAKPLPAGPHRIEWDGLDEQGNVVRPGTYRWRAISHPGVRPEYLFSFCNPGKPPWRTGSGTDNWGPDHSCLVAATAGERWTFVGGPCAESGYAMMALDSGGAKRMHYNQVHGTGIERVALANDTPYLYAAHDGFAWGQHVDRKKADWKATLGVTLTRFEKATGKVVPYGGDRFVTVETYEVGPGSSRGGDVRSLAGLARLDGCLYVSSRVASALIAVDAETGKTVGRINLPDPGPLAVRGDEILAVSGRRIVRVNPKRSMVVPLVREVPAEARGLAAGADARVYVSDGERHVVRVYDRAGRDVRDLGSPGGPYAGPYDPQRMVNPRGLAVAADGRLWVTEERWNPKRLAAWDTATGKVAVQRFGPPGYGAAGAGFDSADPTRWVGQGALWRLDFQAQAAKCVAVLSPQPGHLGGRFRAVRHYTFHRQGGRTFLIGQGSVVVISELRKDGSIRDLAMVGSTHRFSFGCHWSPPEAFVEAFAKAYPDKAGKHGDKGPGVLWVDTSGDGRCQPDEFDFSTACDHFAGGYWLHRQTDLTIRMPATVDGRCVLLTLAPDGFTATGAPKYPSLNDAARRGVPLDLDRNELDTGVDHDGNVVVNAEPAMKCFAPDGRLRWTYPNQWVGVHGSHRAPLPERGVMQGALFFLGMAPFDAKGDVCVVNGNHGRFFFLTSDGMYLDEAFKDVRIGAAVDAHYIGGECFGGCFGRSRADGTYYLQSGHTDYRIFRVAGLDKVWRQEGTVEVTGEQAMAVANRLHRRAAGTHVPKQAAIPRRDRPPKIDGRPDDWGRDRDVRWDKSGRFKASVSAAWDNQALYLCYVVQDDSPWLNHGKDWTTLFKTGDSVDLQIGAALSADPSRRRPVPGDVRLLIAPHEGEPLTVLYRHRVPGAAKPVTFTSPWRSETVDEVRRMENVRVAVTTHGGGYCVEAAVPLAALGLEAPAGKTFQADFGVLFGDPDGRMTTLRSYWSNQATALVNDVPGEIMLTPNLWGTVTFEGTP